jgi:hypothetical protein
MLMRSVRGCLFAFLFAPVCGCMFGPKSLELSHSKYNCAVHQVIDEQLLLNIIRLRYNDTLTQLDLSSIAAQYELDGTLEARPFFSTEGVNLVPSFASFSKILPFAGVSGTNRPTFSMTPLDDADTLRSLFAANTLDSIIFLSETSWPVSTVFRMWVDSMNRVPNAVTGSGPDRGLGTEFEVYRRITDLMQALQDRGQLRFVREEKVTQIGSPLPADSVTPANQVEAAKEKMEYQKQPNNTWILVRRDRKLSVKLDPSTSFDPEAHELRELLRLAHGQNEYELVIGPGIENVDPNNPESRYTEIHIVPRSTVQVLFYLAHGVQVPACHYQCGVVKPPVDLAGQPFDWLAVTSQLFTVSSCNQHSRPKCAYVAVKYRDYWFCIDDRDAESKTAFSLLLSMSRLNLAGAKKNGPALTLPVGR